MATTCGYCSVGCGMFIGVKDGRAVSVRGNPDHPVNRGMLCPKGLSEHHTIDADNRARYPLLKRNGEFARVGWDEAFTTMATQVPRDAGAIRAGVGGRHQHRPARDRGVLRARQARAARHRHAELSTATPRSACPRPSPATSGRSAATVLPGAYEDLERADVIMLIGANIAENHPILCWRLQSNPEHHADRRRSARHQDGDDGRSAPAAEAAVGPRADQRVHPLRDRERPRRSRVHRPPHHRLRRRCGSRFASTRPSGWRRSPDSRPR